MTHLIHSFSVDEAEIYGVEKAVILYNFRFWLVKNRANDTNNINGYVWTYNSAVALTKIWPYLNAKKISRLLKELEDVGALISANHNKIAYDRTKWYSMPEFSTKAAPIVISHICEMDKTELSNGFSKIAPPIPVLNTDIKTDIKSKTSASLKFDDLDLGFANAMYRSLLIQDPNFKKPNLNSWADVIRKMRVIDKRTHDVMAQVWTWARQDSFWYKNILSANSFRDKFQRLYLNRFPANNLKAVISEEKQKRKSITANVLDVNNTDW